MKKVIWGVLTFVVLCVCNYLLCKFFNLTFLELSFITGLGFSILIGYFSSEGGFFSEMVDYQYKRIMDSESRNQNHFIKFYLNTPFIVSIAYTLIAAIVSIIAYWEYFV